MKGIVFSEFLEMVEDKFSLEMSEQLIDELDLISGGAYTSVGTYDAIEMQHLVHKLSAVTNIPVTDLLITFGQHLLHRFADLFPQFFTDSKNVMNFLTQIDSYVHLEVKKLYSDAELPTFQCREIKPDVLEMVYRSSRQLPDLAEGLILGAAEYFGERIEIQRSKCPEDEFSEIFLVTTISN